MQSCQIYGFLSTNKWIFGLKRKCMDFHMEFSPSTYEKSMDYGFYKSKGKIKKYSVS